MTVCCKGLGLATRWIAVGCILVAASVAAASQHSEAVACRVDQVIVTGEEGQVRFRVEVADDAQERGQGLMFRDSMPTGAGMLFVYDAPQPVAFWMRNTLIPLDMLFADQTGVIRKIHVNAIPGDETPIPGGTDIQFVLEINGGLSPRMGLAEGMVISHPAITPELAAKPCR